MSLYKKTKHSLYPLTFLLSALLLSPVTLADDDDKSHTTIKEVHTSYADNSGICSLGVDTLSIFGDGFDHKSKDNLPLSDQLSVSLGEQGVLTLCSASANEIIVECPSGVCPTGNFNLEVSYGKNLKYSVHHDMTLGAQGSQGDAGATGSQGPQGDAGPAGATGSQGSQGDAGPAGPAGTDGAQGPQGDAGPAGADGAQGPQGDAGPAGPAGADGAQGPPGGAAEAGAGLVLSGTTLSIANGGVDNGMLANGAVTDAKVTSVSASKVTGGTFNAANYNANGIWRMTSCPSGYSFTGGTNGNLCWSGWRNPNNHQDAQRDCYDEGAHMCTYSEFYHAWASGTNPAMQNGDFIGDRVGDDLVMCVNNTTDINDFEGTCNKNESHFYRCCMGRGR